MKKYFTISEFAHLRNININSLRYYEKIGLMKPAYVDPENNYRYYAPEQLYQLDIIRLCIDLEMPLKELSDYVNSQGELQIQSLFEDGRERAKEKMKEIQRNLKRIEHSLAYWDTGRAYEQQSGLYVRTMQSRRILMAEEMDTLSNVADIEARFTRLYEKAQNDGLCPVLPSGILMTYTGGRCRYRQFFEIVGDEPAGEPSMTLPEGRYQCIQVDFQTDMDVNKIIEAHFSPERPTPIIVSNMFVSKFHIGNVKTEVQQLMTPEP